jgi:hypothetical protein
MERHGVVNLDLTLTNVLMCRGRARLSDFGIAVIVPTCPVDSSEQEWCLKYDSSFTTLIHAFALAPEVLTQYYAAVAEFDADPSHPQYINLRHQGVRVLGPCSLLECYHSAGLADPRSGPLVPYCTL